MTAIWMLLVSFYDAYLGSVGTQQFRGGYGCPWGVYKSNIETYEGQWKNAPGSAGSTLDPWWMDFSSRNPMQLSGIFGAVHRLRKASDSGPHIAWGQTAWQWKTLVERWAFLWRSVCDSWRELQNMSESENFFESSMLCMYIISIGFHAYIFTQHRIIHEMWDVPGHGNSSWLTFMGGTWIRGGPFWGGCFFKGEMLF